MRQLYVEKNLFSYFSDKEKKKVLENKYNSKVDEENFSVGFSKKGNLVIKERKIKNIISKEKKEKNFQDYLNALNHTKETKVNDVYKIVKQRHIYLNQISNYNDIVDFSIKTTRFIITKDGKFYICSGKKINRISLKKGEGKRIFLNSILSYFYKISKIFNEKEVLDIFKQVFPILSFLENFNFKFDDFDFLCILNNNLILLDVQKDIPKWLKKYLVTKATNANEAVNIINRYLKLTQIGFTDLNVIKKMLSFEHSILFEEAQKNLLKFYFNRLKEYYAKDIFLNIDTIFLNRIFDNEKCYLVNDSLRMFYTHMKNEKNNQNIPKLKHNFFKKSLVENHDYLSSVMRKDNAILSLVDYNYKDEILNFEKEIDGLSFLLPKNSFELTRLSEIMSNCVAGYSNNIKSGNSIIVYATDNQEVIDYIQGKIDLENVYQFSKKLSRSPLCIELSPYKKGEINQNFDEKYYSYYGYNGSGYNVVRQCFERNNNLPSVENGNIANKYFDMLKYHHRDFSIPFKKDRITHYCEDNEEIDFDLPF